MNLQTVIILIVCAAISSAVLTYHYFPQTKTVEITKEVVRTDIQTVVHTVTQPGGVVETTTTTTDHSQRIETSKNTVVALPKLPQYNVSGVVGQDFSERLIKPVYGVSGNMNVFGPLTIGAVVLFNKDVFAGLSIGINF